MSTERYSQPVNIPGVCACGCGAKLPPYRKYFATPECVHSYRLRTDGRYLRHCVFQRDRGICAECGRDTEALKAQMLELKGRARLQFARNKGVPRHRMSGSWWDADHIIPVCEGGGESDIGNLQTLCLLCHADKTRRLARKRVRK